MNINESIISSSFFHLILILLMVAASTYTTDISGGLRNIISVDLTREEKDLPDAAAGSEDEPALTPAPQAAEEASLSDQAAPPEKSKETPEPEKKAEAAAEPAKTENAEKLPAQTGGFTSMEAYYQFMMMHKKIFGQKAKARVNELLGEALKVNKREFFGGTATVMLQFGADSNLREVLVDSASPELKAFLEEMNWAAVPAPAGYSLGFTGVKIEFAVGEGYMNSRIDVF